MGRKKTSTPAESPVAEDFAKDEPLHRPQEDAADKPRTIDVVRAAIAAGFTTAKVAVPWIMKTYGFEMKAGNFSVTKSNIEKRDGKAAGNAAPPKRAYTPRKPKESVAAPAVSAPKAVAHTNGQMSPSEAARSVKDLIDKLGVKEVKNLVELFGG
jgi:hypothetical protein